MAALVREAGGLVTDWDGDETQWLETGDILAGSPAELDVSSLYAVDPFVVHGIFVLERVLPWVVFVDNRRPD